MRKFNRAKYHMLKEIETYVYRVAYYMLDERERAVEASKQTLREVASHEPFFNMDDEGRTHFVRNIAIRKSLMLKANL